MYELGSKIENKQDLVKINTPLKIRGKSYQPMGFLQFLHDEGYRTEWWLLDEDEQTYWLSQEDEDLFLVTPLDSTSQIEVGYFPAWELLQPNTQVDLGGSNWQVVEKRILSFHGYKGSLPFDPSDKKQLKYSYLTNPKAESLILIHNEKQILVRKGWWLDPLDVLTTQQEREVEE